MTLRGVLRTYALVWGITLATAAIVAVVPGAAAATRDALQLRLEPTAGDWRAALGYFTTNARVIAVIILAASARSQSGPLGWLLDALVAVVMVGNTSLVGAALGTYGSRAVPWLVHLPAEWAALAIAAHGFRHRRASLCSARAGFQQLAAAVLALAAAAVLESFATPQT